MPAHSAEKHLTASQVFAVTGVRRDTQLQWDNRGVTIPWRRDKLSSGSGDPHLKSLATIMQLAITHELVGLHVRPKDAAKAVRKFTHEGQPGRKPGELFEHFKTVLVVTPDDASVHNVGFDVRIADVTAHHACAVVVDINRIVAAVTDKLSKLKGRK